MKSEEEGIKLELDKQISIVTDKFPTNVDNLNNGLKLITIYCFELGAKTNATHIICKVDEVKNKDTGENMGSLKLEWFKYSNTNDVSL